MASTSILTHFLVVILCWNCGCQGYAHHVAPPVPDITNHVISSSDELPSLPLPQIVSISIKFGIAKFWNIEDIKKSGSCLSDQVSVIKGCGATDLYANIVGKTRKSRDSHDFRWKLESICRRYDEYQNCLSSHAVVLCKSPIRTVIDIYYGYICGDGKKDLLSVDDAGMCLTKIQRKDVTRLVSDKEHCEYAFTDISLTLESTFSIYHDHDEDQGLQTPAIKQHLYRLCRSWHTLESCIFPAYGQLCGRSAQTFYVNLVNRYKQSLVEEFGHLGKNLTNLARCDSNTGKEVAAKPQSLEQTSAISQYIKRQAAGYVKYAWRLRTSYKYGPCHRLTTNMDMISCFWMAVASIGPQVMSMSADLTHHGQAVCTKFLRPLNRCYTEETEGCAADRKINFDSMIDAACELFANPEMLTCLETISEDHISQQRCGIDISDLTNYYVFQGSMIYSNAQISCADNYSFETFPNASCVAHALSGFTPPVDVSRPETSCVKVVLPLVQKLLFGVDEVMAQAAVFFKQMFDDQCKG